MSGSGAASLPAAHHARRLLARHGPRPLSLGLETLETSGAPAALAHDCWAAAGTVRAIAGEYARAGAVSGRAVADLTFALHRRLGLVRSGPAATHVRLDAIEPFMDWLGPRLGAESPWRALAARWIDIFSERLAMSRYPDPDRRRRHGRDLLAEPMALLAREHGVSLAETPVELAERALRFWDLFRAEDGARRGWNRIDLPAADRLGGFFALADEARPPAPDRIRRAAGELAEEIRHRPAPAMAPLLDPWAARLDGLMLEACRDYAATGRRLM